MLSNFFASSYAIFHHLVGHVVSSHQNMSRAYNRRKQSGHQDQAEPIDHSSAVVICVVRGCVSHQNVSSIILELHVHVLIRSLRKYNGTRSLHVQCFAGLPE